jgi:uncharacterized protein (TIGR03546 family)
MITRKIAKIIRGKATPLQLTFACLLGALLGFTPGFGQGPGLWLLLLALLAVLNANLWLAAMVAAAAKALSLALLPLQFEAGRLVIDGPGQPLVRAAVNAPVLAWFGLEYYAVTGGVVLGLLFGALCSVAVVVAVRVTRTRLASMQEGRIADAFAGSKLLRFVAWIVVGGKAKESYERLNQRRVGNPVRPLGVAIVVLSTGLGAILLIFTQGPIVTGLMRSGLERANGATVDLESADVDLGAGVVTVSGLAMADPEDLGTDLLRAGTLTADLGTRDLLRRRFAFDLVEVSNASSGEARRTPGRLVRPRPKPPAPAGESKTIEDYLADAERWRERLTQAREWLEKVQKPAEETSPGDGPQPETTAERARRHAREHGYSRARADHLIEGAPTVLVRDLRIDGLTLADLPGEILDVSAAMLSTNASLVQEGQPIVSLTSRSGSLSGELRLASRAGERSRIVLTRLGLAGDSVGRMLAVGGTPPVSGGTVDLAIDASLAGPFIDGTIDATLRGTTLALAGSQTTVETLTLPIGIDGPLDRPGVTFRDEDLADALIAAGKDEAAKRLMGEADKLLDETLENSGVGSEIGSRAKGLLGGLLGGDGKKDEKQGEKKDE